MNMSCQPPMETTTAGKPPVAPAARNGDNARPPAVSRRTQARLEQIGKDTPWTHVMDMETETRLSQAIMMHMFKASQSGLAPVKHRLFGGCTRQTRFARPSETSEASLEGYNHQTVSVFDWCETY